MSATSTWFITMRMTHALNTEWTWHNQTDRQWLKCHWMQGNAVPAPLVIEIHHSHTSDFIKTPRGPQTPVSGRKADAQFPHLGFSTLTWLHNRNSDVFEEIISYIHIQFINGRSDLCNDVGAASAQHTNRRQVGMTVSRTHPQTFCQMRHHRDSCLPPTTLNKCCSQTSIQQAWRKSTENVYFRCTMSN